MKLKNSAKIMVSSLLLAVGAALFSGLVVPGFGIASAIGIATGIVSIAVPLVMAAVAGLVVGGIVAAGMHYLGKNGSENTADFGDRPLVTGVLSTLLAATVLAAPLVIVATLFPPFILGVALVGAVTLGVTFIVSYRLTKHDNKNPKESPKHIEKIETQYVNQENGNKDPSTSQDLSQHHNSKSENNPNDHKLIKNDHDDENTTEQESTDDFNI